MKMLMAGIVLSLASSSYGQIFYQPVKYQYGTQRHFYYGGDDPRFLNFAAASDAEFIGGNVDTHRPASDEPERVYTDSVPFQNARIYGFTAGDARNEAYARVATYFRKRDLLAAAVRTADGWIVPAHASPGDVVPDGFIAPAPAIAPIRPLLIIPKPSPPRESATSAVAARDAGD